LTRGKSTELASLAFPASRTTTTPYFSRLLHFNPLDLVDGQPVNIVSTVTSVKHSDKEHKMKSYSRCYSVLFVLFIARGSGALPTHSIIGGKSKFSI
jgi:hypothetical protein